MSNRTLIRILAASGLALGTIAANAVPITLTDTFDPQSNIVLGAGSANYDFTHDLNALDFNASLDTVLSATLTLDIADDGDNDYNSYGYGTYVTYCHWGHCHYGTYSYVTSYGQPEYLNVSADLADLGNYEIDYSALIFSIPVSDLQFDGLLDVTLNVQSGDLLFRSSTLSVEVERATAVAEPGTLALLGIGLLSAGVRRRTRDNSTATRGAP